MIIFVWSKLVSPKAMREFCFKTKINLPKEEIDMHKKAYSMRYDGKSYDDISAETNIPKNELAWYISANPNHVWTLDDWIADYYMKDSSIYSKVDAIIDTDAKLVERFAKQGIIGNVLEPLK